MKRKESTKPQLHQDPTDKRSWNFKEFIGLGVNPFNGYVVERLRESQDYLIENMKLKYTHGISESVHIFGTVSSFIFFESNRRCGTKSNMSLQSGIISRRRQRKDERKDTIESCLGNIVVEI